jgi:hypothetical protein
MLSLMVTVGAVVSAVVPPPPHADKRAAAAKAMAASGVLYRFMEASLGLVKLKALANLFA